MSHKTTCPLEIKCTLKDGTFVSTDGVIMFDAILYHAWFAKHHPEVLEGDYSDVTHLHVGLPLVQEPGNRYKASRGVYVTEHLEVAHINKRPDFFAGDKYDKLADVKGIISEGVGQFRAYRIPLIVRTVKGGEITFCAEGTPEKVADLLSYINFVGKKHAAGFGAVAKWEVKEALRVEVDVDRYDGLMRPMPVDEWKDIPLHYPVMMYGIRPPYWSPKNERLCYVPVCN